MTNYYRALPILLGLIVAAASNAYADIGQIKNVSGAVFVLRQNVQQPAKAGDLVQQSDVLITGANGRGRTDLHRRLAFVRRPQ